MSPTITGFVLGFSSAILWSFANLTIQGSSRRFGSFAALLGAQIIGGAALMLVAAVTDGLPRLPTSTATAALAAAGFAAAFAYGGLFLALECGAVTVIAPIVSAWAAVATVVGIIGFDESPTARGTIGIGAILLGNVLLSRFGEAHHDANRKTPRSALVAAVVSALGFGVMIPAMDLAANEIGPLWTPPLTWCCQWFAILAFARRRMHWVARPHEARDWRLLALPGLLEAGGLAAVALGLRFAPTWIVAPASSLSTALSVLIGVVIARERLTRLGWLGAAAASIGVLLLA